MTISFSTNSYYDAFNHDETKWHEGEVATQFGRKKSSHAKANLKIDKGVSNKRGVPCLWDIEVWFLVVIDQHFDIPKGKHSWL